MEPAPDAPLQQGASAVLNTNDMQPPSFISAASAPATGEPSLPSDTEETPRGRLKRRRPPTHSPTRSPSPCRAHDRRSASRYRHTHHQRKHHRALSLSQPSSSRSTTPQPQGLRNRRRSETHADHGLRGRSRIRSPDDRRTQSPVLEGEEEEAEEGRGNRRKRSQPPSRRRSGSAVGDVRRQRSFPNLYREDGGV